MDFRARNATLKQGEGFQWNNYLKKHKNRRTSGQKNYATIRYGW